MNLVGDPRKVTYAEDTCKEETACNLAQHGTWNVKLTKREDSGGSAVIKEYELTVIYPCRDVSAERNSVALDDLDDWKTVDYSSMIDGNANRSPLDLRTFYTVE